MTTEYRNKPYQLLQDQIRDLKASPIAMTIVLLDMLHELHPDLLVALVDNGHDLETFQVNLLGCDIYATAGYYIAIDPEIRDEQK